MFSLIWSIGASTENEGRSKFDGFLRKLLCNEVDPKPDRKDFDLGPGVMIREPGFKITVPLPKVSTLSIHIFDIVPLFNSIVNFHTILNNAQCCNRYCDVTGNENQLTKVHIIQ